MRTTTALFLSNESYLERNEIVISKGYRIRHWLLMFQYLQPLKNRRLLHFRGRFHSRHCNVHGQQRSRGLIRLIYGAGVKMQRPFNPQIVSQNALIILSRGTKRKKRKTRAKIMQISSPFSSVYLPIAVGKEPVVFVPGGEVPMAIAHLWNRGSRPLL